MPTDQIGSFRLAATAMDAAANVGEDRRTVTISDPNDQLPPVIGITSPSSGAHINSFTDIAGNLADSDGQISYYEVSVAPAGSVRFSNDRESRRERVLFRRSPGTV